MEQRSSPAAGAAPRPDVPRRPASRPDARPMRAILGFTGIAAATAMATAIVQPPTGATDTTTTITQDVVAQSAAPVRHVTQYVQLKTGQTAPPNATVKTVPKPTPRVVVMTTHQSGKP